jgi:RND family efflux transporter MFP subunit
MLRKLKKTLAERKKLILALGILLVVFLIGRNLIIGKNKGLIKESVKRGTVAQEMVLSGEVKAIQDAKLYFAMPGELAWLGVKEGDLVKKEQVLVRLDTTNLYASYEMATSDLRLAQTVLDRVYDEVKGHETDESFLLREKRTTAEVTKDKAYRALTIAGKNLSNASLRAPFDGVIANVTYPFPGIYLFNTNYMIQIVNPKTFYFEVVADQTEVVDLKVGQKVGIKLDSFEEAVEGEVEYISLSPIEGEAGATYRVKIKIDDWPFDLNEIKVGMTGDAKFILSERQNVLYLPPKFINSDQKGKYVNLGRKNNKVYIETGIEGDDRVEVKGNINEGNVVYD